MRKKIFVFCVSLLFTSKVSADCTYGGSNCLTWNPGVTDNCGPGCTYTYDDENQTVYVTTSGDNPYMRAVFTPYSYDGNHFPSGVYFNKMIVDGPITFGSNVFEGTLISISGADGTLILQNIGHHAFGDDATLVGDIIIPVDAQFDSLAFHGVKLAESAKIYCAVENCKQKMEESCNFDDTHGYQTRCLNAVETITADSSKFEQAPQGCLSLNGNGCQSCHNGYSLNQGHCVCSGSHRLNGKYCNRLIYTIEEANRVAGEKNRVSITYR